MAGTQTGQRNVPGYGRELTQDEQASLSRFHEVSTELNTQIQRLRSQTNIDQRWLQEAERQLQVGFMCVYRAIERPTTF